MVLITEYSIWSVLQEKVYRSKIADVDELKTRLIDGWAQFDQFIVYAAISKLALSSKYFCPCMLAHFEHKFWKFWIELLCKRITICDAKAQQTPSPVLRIAASRSFSELTKNVLRSSHGHSTPSLKISCKSVQPFAANVDKCWIYYNE